MLQNVKNQCNDTLQGGNWTYIGSLSSWLASQREQVTIVFNIQTKHQLSISTFPVMFTYNAWNLTKDLVLGPMKN